MKNTRKNKVIYYTGIKSRKNGKHSIKNFKKITNSNSSCKEMKNYCPKPNNIKGWIKFYGAEYTSPTKCNSIVKGK